jgi:hypothetical protein
LISTHSQLERHFDPAPSSTALEKGIKRDGSSFRSGRSDQGANGTEAFGEHCVSTARIAFEQTSKLDFGSDRSINQGDQCPFPDCVFCSCQEPVPLDYDLVLGLLMRYSHLNNALHPVLIRANIIPGQSPPFSSYQVTLKPTSDNSYNVPD